MRKVLRGYAKVKDGHLILIGTIPVPHSKYNRRLENVKTEDIWSGKAQRSLRRNSLIENCQSTLGSLFATAVGSVLSVLSP